VRSLVGERAVAEDPVGADGVAERVGRGRRGGDLRIDVGGDDGEGVVEITAEIEGAELPGEIAQRGDLDLPEAVFRMRRVGRGVGRDDVDMAVAGDEQDEVGITLERGDQLGVVLVGSGVNLRDAFRIGEALLRVDGDVDREDHELAGVLAFLQFVGEPGVALGIDPGGAEVGRAAGGAGRFTGVVKHDHLERQIGLRGKGVAGCGVARGGAVEPVARRRRGGVEKLADVARGE